jgi:hypothetical protein
MGGCYQGRVRSIGLTFTTLDSEEGPLHVPNLGLISAVTGPRTPPETPRERTLTLTTSQPASQGTGRRRDVAGVSDGAGHRV